MTDAARMWRFMAAVCAFAGLIVVLGCSSGQLRTAEGAAPSPGLEHFAADSGYIGWPTSVADLVRGPGDFTNLYDIIAVGVISEVVATGQLTAPVGFMTEDHDVRLPPISYIDYQLSFEQTFLDDGTIAANERVLVRVYTGYWEAKNYPSEGIGDRFLYFLIRDQVADDQVPGAAYYLKNAWTAASRLIIDGDTVRYSDGGRCALPFATGTPPAAFLDALATEVAVQNPIARPQSQRSTPRCGP